MPRSRSLALAGRTGARLLLVRAAHAASITTQAARAQLQALSEAEGYLDLRAADLRAHDYVVETGVPYGANAAEWIVEEAELREADMILMGTHDRVGPDRWIHGSVAEAVGRPGTGARHARARRPQYAPRRAL